MPPKPSSSRSTAPTTEPLPNHYEALLPFPTVKSKDPHFFTNRYLLPGRSPILRSTFKKFKPIPDSPPNEGEVHGCYIETEKNLIAKAARRLARQAEQNGGASASEAGRAHGRRNEVVPGESVSSVGITRRRTVNRAREGEASGSGSTSQVGTSSGTGGGEAAPRRRTSRRATAPPEAPATEQRNDSPERLQETPVEVLLAIQNYGMEPSAAVLARLGMSRELYRVVFDMHVAPDSILRRRG